jgi:large subunit ribosomal protein L31
LTQHPQLHLVGVVCSSCGATYTVRSATTAISADVCANCHPAYTGIDRATAAGTRIDRFDRRRALAAA